MYNCKSVNVFYQSVSINLPRQWSTKIECFSHTNLSVGGASVYCPILLIVSESLWCVEEKVACSGKWITLFWFEWYLVVNSFFVCLGLPKSVTSWLIYEEKSFLFCSKTFHLCFSDLSEFHRGQWRHPFCICIMALHLINNLWVFF